MAASDDDDIQHSEMGPSTAHRWRACPGSVALSRGIPNIAGMAAAEGTMFHEIAATCTEFFLDPQGFVGDQMEVAPHGMILFDQKMADHMLYGLDLLWALADTPGVKMIVEKRVSLERWVGDGEFGTTDCAIIDVVGRRIYVFDWKYGAGVPVSPVRNDQAILYFLGVWDDYAYEMFYNAQYDAAGGAGIWEEAPWEDDIEVVIMIEQPRAPGGGGTWTTTVGELLGIGEKIKKDAKLAKSPEGALVFNPGPKQCQFCPAARVNICTARARMALEEAGLDFDMLEEDYSLNLAPEMKHPRALTPQQRSQVIMHKPMIEKFLEQLHEEAYADAKMGRPVPGMKLVDGRNPPRKWKDETRAQILLVHDLKDKAFTKKLLTPTAVEETVGKREYKARFARMVDTGESKSILVPDTDKRAALPDITSDFDVLANNDDGLI